MDGKATAAVILIMGLVVGFGFGFFGPQLFPPQQPPPEQTLVEKIQARGYIIIGTSSGWPPFEMYNSTSHVFYGFDIDLCEMVADYLNVTIQWNDMDFDVLVGSCSAGTIDMIAAAMFITPDRADELSYSIPYIRTNEIVVVKGTNPLEIDNLTELVGLDVGVQTGTVEDEEISALIDDGYAIVIHRYAKADLMFADLDTGSLDAVYVDEPVLTVYSKIYGIRGIFVVPAPPTALFCRYEDPDLLKAINTVIMDGFSTGELDALIAEWFG